MDFEPSRQLSFVIGAFLGDGTFVEDSDYHHFVRLSVRDLEFAEAFNHSVAKLLLRKTNKITISRNNGKVFYDAKYSSRELGLFLKQPIENLRASIDDYPAPFLRGLFSADGGVGVSIYRRDFSVEVALGNSNLNLLEMTQDVLRSRFQIHSMIYLSQTKGKTWKYGKKIVVLRKNAYVLRVQRVLDVRTFAAKIGFAIVRKQEMLDTAVNLMKRLGRAKAAEGWMKYYSKVGSRWRRTLTD